MAKSWQEYLQFCFCSEHAYDIVICTTIFAHLNLILKAVNDQIFQAIKKIYRMCFYPCVFVVSTNLAIGVKQSLLDEWYWLSHRTQFGSRQDCIYLLTVEITTALKKWFSPYIAPQTSSWAFHIPKLPILTRTKDKKMFTTAMHFISKNSIYTVRQIFVPNVIIRHSYRMQIETDASLFLSDPQQQSCNNTKKWQIYERSLIIQLLWSDLIQTPHPNTHLAMRKIAPPTTTV